MLQTTFNYEIKGVLVQVHASCKSVLEDDVEDLTLTFLDENDTRIRIPYDQELFEDLEYEALAVLSEMYYNPELSFGR